MLILFMDISIFAHIHSTLFVFHFIPFVNIIFARIFFLAVIPSTSIYHAGQSSTSSDLSPPLPSDQHQKSLSRCMKSRYHQHFHNLNLNTTPRHKSDSISSARTIALQDENGDRMLSSQFRPIHTTSSRTINLSKGNL